MVSVEEFKRSLSPPPIATAAEPTAFTLTLNLNAFLHQTCRNCGHKMSLPSADIEKLNGYAYQKKQSYERPTTTLHQPLTAKNEGELEL